MNNVLPVNRDGFSASACNWTFARFRLSSVRNQILNDGRKAKGQFFAFVRGQTSHVAVTAFVIGAFHGTFDPLIYSDVLGGFHVNSMHNLNEGANINIEYFRNERKNTFISSNENGLLREGEILPP